MCWTHMDILTGSTVLKVTTLSLYEYRYMYEYRFKVLNSHKCHSSLYLLYVFYTIKNKIQGGMRLTSFLKIKTLFFRTLLEMSYPSVKGVSFILTSPF